MTSPRLWGGIFVAIPTANRKVALQSKPLPLLRKTGGRTLAKNATLGALDITHGLNNGNKVRIASGQVQLTKPQYQDMDGVAMLQLGRRQLCAKHQRKRRTIHFGGLMLKLTQSQTYTWPVSVNIPTNGGQYDKQTFDGELKRLTDARLKEIRAKVEAGELTDAEFVREVMVGWHGVTDGDEQVPFSQSALAQLLDIPSPACRPPSSWLLSSR